METQKTANNLILRKKKGAGEIRLIDFRLCYRAIVIKIVWYWHKNRNTNQWNRIEIPKINPHTYDQLIYDKGGKNIQWRKDSLFNKCCWEDYTVTWKKMELEYYLTSHTKINSKGIKGLSITLDTIKFLEENTGRTLTKTVAISFWCISYSNRNKDKNEEIGSN